VKTHMNCYVLLSEPAGSVYRDLVDFCCLLSSRMILVVRDPHIDCGDSIRGHLAELRQHLVEVARVREWPGTILHADEAEAYSYQVTADLGELLKVRVSRLFEWIHPSAPEDPCFFRSNGQVVLVTTAHESDAYLMLTGSEFALLGRSFPDLANHVQKED
jgi:hypothetical protein